MSLPGLKLIVPPSVLAVTLADVKAWLNVEHDERDDTITALIEGAVEDAEEFMGRALVDQTFDLVLDAFPEDEIVLPRPPLIEVVGVFYADADGVEQEWDVGNYVVANVQDRDQPGRVVLTAGGEWPTTSEDAGAVRVRFRAGYIEIGSSPEAPAVPGSIAMGVRYQVKADFDGGEAAGQWRDAAVKKWRRHKFNLSLA